MSKGKTKAKQRRKYYRDYKSEYIRGECSTLADFARKHGLDYKRLRSIAGPEQWIKKRKEYQEEYQKNQNL